MVAPDSFKGSLSSARFCTVAERTLRALDPAIDVQLCPLADGGEGTVHAVVTAMGGHVRTYTVTGPLRAEVAAEVGFSPDGKLAVVEMAAASGLTLLSAAERDPLHATSYGTGELLRHALDSGVERVVLGLGGTATNDGGAGMLQALGCRLLDGAGQALPLGAQSLTALSRIDTSGLHPRLAAVELTVASDVTNPLLGPQGATAVFGPQKGVSAATGVLLEQGLARFATVAEAESGRAVRDAPGAGAAGGAGFALLGLLGARLEPGFDVVAGLTGFGSRLQSQRYDWLLTGEGKIDRQSRGGKFLSRIGRLAAAAQTPTIAFTGWLDGDESLLGLVGIDHIFPLAAGPCTLAEAMAEVETLLSLAIKRVMGLALRRPRQ